MLSSDTFLNENRHIISLAKKILDTLILSSPMDHLVLLREWNTLHTYIGNTAASASLMVNVHPDKDMREAGETIEQEVQQFATALGLNRDVYELFVRIDIRILNEEDKRLVEHTLRDFRRSGVDKDEEMRNAIKELNEKLVKISQEFERNIREDVRFIDVDSVEDLAGLPEDYIASHPFQENGKIRITTDYPDSKPFLQYAKKKELRRELFLLSQNRAYPQNENVFTDLLQCRYTLATLLGYTNWVEYVTEDKMIKNGANIGAFIDQLSIITKEKSAQEYAVLLTEKQKDEPTATTVEEWEFSFYKDRVKNNIFAFDSKSVRPYLEYQKVKQGILDLTSELFGLRYERIDMPVWHEQVEVYDVYDETEKRGRFYLDMHPRENKYKHAAQFTIKSGVAGVQLPESALVCNFTDPKTAHGPALLDHYQVTTFFHEFGHLLHSILGGNQKWIQFSGVATEWDFVEAPSQLFEEWTWEADVLQRFAKHVETGEPLPSDLISTMRAAEDFGHALFVRQQIFYTSLSYHYYNQSPEGLDIMGLLQALQEKYAPFAHIPNTHFPYNFGHLDGYSAMYYTYMWSLVIAKDIVSAFKIHGMMNKDLSMKYRHTILELGGSKDANDLVKDFLGRDYSFDAFKQWLEGKK